MCVCCGCVSLCLHFLFYIGISMCNCVFQASNWSIYLLFHFCILVIFYEVNEIKMKFHQEHTWNTWKSVNLSRTDHGNFTYRILLLAFFYVDFRMNFVHFMHNSSYFFQFLNFSLFYWFTHSHLDCYSINLLLLFLSLSSE